MNPLQSEIDFYLAPVPLEHLLPINNRLFSCKESTMISSLGSPLMPLATTDQPDWVSPVVKKLLQTLKIGQHLIVTGIGPAIDSLKIVLQKAFRQEKAKNHDFESVLSNDGMLNVRLRKPISGKPSTHTSNHAWGTSIDFKINGHNSPGNTGHTIPRFVAVLLPFLNQAGWFSGIGFHDTMHFEVSENYASVANRWKTEWLTRKFINNNSAILL